MKKNKSEANKQKAPTTVGSGVLLGVMVLAWFVSAVGNWTTLCWWHSERMQWGASASKYQQEIQELKQQVLQLQLSASTNSVGASYPSESETGYLLSQSYATQVFEALLMKPLTPFDAHPLFGLHPLSAFCLSTSEWQSSPLPLMEALRSQQLSAPISQSAAHQTIFGRAYIEGVAMTSNSSSVEISRSIRFHGFDLKPSVSLCQ